MSRLVPSTKYQVPRKLFAFAGGGFSLVELMVVISIIAVVSMAAFSSLNAIQSKGRDTQRQADLRTIQSALQQYYASENHYPDTMTLNNGAAFSANGRTYLTSTPKDPVSGTSTPYCYISLRSSQAGASSCESATPGECHYYELYANLENSAGASSYTCNSVNYNFKISTL